MVASTSLTQRLIHRSAWKGDSANFALPRFSEVYIQQSARSAW